MTKPVFLWWAHKEMWDILAKQPMLSKYEAIELLQKKYDVRCPNSACFACHALRLKTLRLDIDCFNIWCPLDWGVERRKAEYGSYSGIVANAHGCVSSLFGKWTWTLAEKDYDNASKLAAKIRDLPLTKYAHKFYTIEEAPQVTIHKSRLRSPHP